MNIAAGFQNLSDMFKGLRTSTPAVEILEPEQERTSNHAKDEIVGLMARIGDFLSDMQGGHPYIDTVTTMQNGYIGVIMSNPEKTASQIVAYTLGEDKNGNPQVNKETTRIIKADQDDFPEKNSTETLVPVEKSNDEAIYAEKLAQMIIEDIADTFDTDQIALTAAVQGKGVVDNAHDGGTYEAITAE